jgi:polyferredoxin
VALRALRLLTARNTILLLLIFIYFFLVILLLIILFFIFFFFIFSFLYFFSYFYLFLQQVRDLLRGDPDTDVKIVFDREESSYFIKKQKALASRNLADAR